jgi:hypothetical protein
VAVGAAGPPTPAGRTFLLALLAPPRPTYSPLILPLGPHSNTLSTFGGGPGTVGLHGWPDPSAFGHADLDPGLRPTLLALVDPQEQGDPMSPLRRRRSRLACWRTS